MKKATNARQQTLQHELASKLETVLSTIFSWECECYMIHGKKYNSLFGTIPKYPSETTNLSTVSMDNEFIECSLTNGISQRIGTWLWRRLFCCWCYIDSFKWICITYLPIFSRVIWPTLGQSDIVGSVPNKVTLMQMGKTTCTILKRKTHVLITHWDRRQ